VFEIDNTLDVYGKLANGRQSKRHGCKAGLAAKEGVQKVAASN